MIDKKINNLKNIIFIKSIICASLIIYSIYIAFILKENYQVSISRLNMVRPLLAEIKIKLNEIADSHSNISDGIKKYEEIFGKTEEERCKEYNDILIKISNLGAKYNLQKPINTIIQTKPTRINNSHNKLSYISVYDLTIEYDSYYITDALEIYKNIISLLPKYKIIYFTDIKEILSVTPRKISPLHVDVKPSLIRSRISVKMRDITLTKKY